MEYRRLGKSGLKVSEICLGTMTFGHGADESRIKAHGGSRFRCWVSIFLIPQILMPMANPKFCLGRHSKVERRDAVVATKFFNPMGTGPNDSGMSRAHIMQAIDDSLTRLQMDYVDIYYIHHVDSQTPLEEMLRTVDDLVRQGKVRYTACSNYQAWRLSEALWISDITRLGTDSRAINRNIVSLFEI